MLLSTICRQFCRGINIRTRVNYNLSAFNVQQANFNTSSIHLFQHRISAVPDSVQKRLRKVYGLSDDYYVVYKEPKLELNAMVYLKGLELFTYCTPFLGLSWLYLENENLSEYISNQDDFWVGIAIVCVYLLGINYFTRSFVKIIFHDRKKDIYRAYVLKKFLLTYTYVEFTSQDLQVVNLPPSIPLTNKLFKVGKQPFIFHDSLFSSQYDQDKLTGDAIERWLARWRK